MIEQSNIFQYLAKKTKYDCLKQIFMTDIKFNDNQSLKDSKIPNDKYFKKYSLISLDTVYPRPYDPIAE